MVAWNIGGVELEMYEEPSDGFVEFGASARWAYLKPIGAMYLRTRQFLGIDQNDHELTLFCGEVTKDALVALVTDQPITIIAPRPKFENGVDFTVESVSARWTKQTPGCWSTTEIAAALVPHPTGDGFGLYEVTMKLVELGEV